ncbi:SRPBCC family protein [Polaribacter sp. Z014]|uniref:SRPBCC family protein n=1 Tax=unclassified Polaribacter TaxID=196858 RepID=UPI00193C84CA|nr:MULTISPECIES: SRPBCC family protein [unclassified Polaribacter]MCL7765183.1 SRPBCC family protein [Polaribacter sp. Z014]QVY67021.1 SRPBCC family protein [Polaribacter sp. Q13]
MKTIKIILGIISTIVVAFLLTGLFVKETTYTATISVNKSVEEVFKIFNNSEDIKNWIPEVQSFEVMNDNPGKTGSIYKIVVLNQGQEITMTEKVMAYVPNEKVTLFFDAEGMLKKDDYTFTEENGVTTITLNVSCQSETYLMACVFPFFKGTFIEQDQSYLNNFKAFAEKQ